MKAHVLAILVLAGCDKPADPAPAASASATPSVVPVASSAPVASASGSAAPTVDPLANPKEVIVSIKDAATEPSKSIKAQLGGSVTVFLPDSSGASWTVDVADKALGKAKEETMPGFAPGVNAHQFKFSTSPPTTLKAGETHKATFVNKKAGTKFALTIEFTA